ncbi:N-acetylglucosamine-1-phosphotransferase subunits alpha/beta [Anopheles ziemanni]|uniref:N-acetylglucosamine-1-phosphotransferase subunits alpha/beta n=1 Tax=Anopheles coustani TaxID=139045 RepID=UPI002659F67F|nr:N-acetylglucosamine-1-phosphotransferase subunits alpha/beta [Anopheles coustani]XP_058174461.1 N-acetylglucosamine-1-phosphotransferase subunits alpha/beta [Anopheles ziemanni]
MECRGTPRGMKRIARWSCAPGLRSGKFRFRCCCAVTVLALLTFSYIIVHLVITHTSKNSCHNCYEVIDVVYTWVNGSDPRFLDDLALYSATRDKARYDDKNELRYSLRSLEKYAPWVRNVYIVTNGQVPCWLNLENSRVRIVTHSEIADADTALPTFSSASIETFIHRIPGLSRHFLYLNDDIFLGAPLYPDDLITLAEGVKVFTAWIVPDCAPDCPWMFVGDGSCDRDCFVEDCQYDGGDCEHADYEGDIDHQHLHDVYGESAPEGVEPVEEEGEQMFIDVPKMFPKTGSVRASLNIRDIHDIFRAKEANGTSSTRQLVERFNNEKMNSNKLNVKKRNVRNHSRRNGVVAGHNRTVGANGKDDAKLPSPADSTVNSQDIFANSLIHTNRVFNRAYGFHNRKVLAHVGFLLNVDTVGRMLERFRDEFFITKQHRFRANNDMQYAFSYFHFLMSESRNKTVGEIFDDFDTDASGTWSDREIRTLLAKVYKLPLDWSAVRYFEEVVTNCSLQQNNFLPLEHQQEQRQVYPTLVYERYEDSTIPTVTKSLVVACSELADMMRANFGRVPRYRYHVSAKTGIYSNFKMLTSNITQVVDALDELRKTPKKFNCINDNLGDDRPEDNQLIAALLEDFYLSLFPARSAFELESAYRNRFQYYDDYRSWLRRKTIFRNAVYLVCGVIFLICVRMLCFRHKGKFARTLLLLGATRSTDYSSMS